MIYGNIDGIRNSTLNRLEEIYEFKMPQTSICNLELMEIVSDITEYLNREICVLIDRKGNVIRVSVGDSSSAEIESSKFLDGKLSKIRIIHTHPNGNSKFSSLDISVLLKLKLDCIVAIGVKSGVPSTVSIGFCKVCDGKITHEVLKNLSPRVALNYNIQDKINYIEGLMTRDRLVEPDLEKAILVGIDSMSSLDELEKLAEACNVFVLDKVLQKRTVQDSTFYVGRGKVQELSFLAQIKGANLIIFDDELSGSQMANIEDILGLKIIDRTTLILDIFARRARSKEAKIQVELAQLKYRLTRLSGIGVSLSRTGGGIGTRGPGEKKLEIDRRHIRNKIYEMTSELKKIAKVREVQRKRRKDMPKISLVGYTNAGKSTLRNSLCELESLKSNLTKKKVLEADMLFATLDTTTRAIELKDGRVVALTDTVGFVKKLPHELIEAFKSTLEEVIYSDLLLHVVDVSSEDAITQIEAVDDVLIQLGVKDKPILLVLNKIDREINNNINKIKENYTKSNIVCISAKEKLNFDVLLDNISNLIENDNVEADFLIPYSNQKIVAYLHENSKIKSEEYKDNGTFISALVDEKTYNKYKEFILQK
ncbi:GTPase HflX [Clostridium sp. cel8]|uniref:GTPase HflX n=1 Tax=Clostridium sp. cel8 TaxID=2663123 RepID=UPI0015F4BB63|nr:GTPase HflX [Clostridium sp. cel8]